MSAVKSEANTAILQNTLDLIRTMYPDSSRLCKEFFRNFIWEFGSAFSDERDSRSFIVGRLTSYIEEHYSEDLNLYDIAQNQFFMHPNYLSKLLKDVTGSSFSKYLLDVRMKNALRMLSQRDLSISTIAQLVGYNSESYFVQVFHKYYGKTPGTYRKSSDTGSDAE